MFVITTKNGTKASVLVRFIEWCETHIGSRMSRNKHPLDEGLYNSLKSTFGTHVDIGDERLRWQTFEVSSEEDASAIRAKWNHILVKEKS